MLHKAGLAWVIRGGAVALAVHLAGQVSAQPTAPACDIAGFATDRDPRGTNIRALPRQDATVIGRLPPPLRHDGTSFDVEFRIIGFQDNWMRIRDAAFGDYFPRRPSFRFPGPGWVHASLVSLQTGSHRLRSAPAADAPTVLELRGEDAKGNGWGPDSVAIRRIHGCAGKYADVTLRTPSGREARGWVRNICANQVTTCDGYDPDEDEGN
jgi:hypothetical protein